MESRYLICFVKIWVGDLASVAQKASINVKSILDRVETSNRTLQPGANSAMFLLASWTTFNIKDLSMWFPYILYCANDSCFELFIFLPITNNANWHRQDNVCKIDFNISSFAKSSPSNVQILVGSNIYRVFNYLWLIIRRTMRRSRSPNSPILSLFYFHLEYPCSHSPQ